MARTKTRVVGGGNTIMKVNGTQLKQFGGASPTKNGGKTVAFLKSMSDTPPTPVATSETIQSMDSKYPDEIVTANAVGAGTMTYTLVELWDGMVWQSFPGYETATDILGVLVNNTSANLSFTKLIMTPDGTVQRTKEYTGAVITSIDETETVTNGTMTKTPTVTVMYTRATWT